MDVIFSKSKCLSSPFHTHHTGRKGAQIANTFFSTQSSLNRRWHNEAACRRSSAIVMNAQLQLWQLVKSFFWVLLFYSYPHLWLKAKVQAHSQSQNHHVEASTQAKGTRLHSKEERAVFFMLFEGPTVSLSSLIFCPQQTTANSNYPDKQQPEAKRSLSFRKKQWTLTTKQ